MKMHLTEYPAIEPHKARLCERLGINVLGTMHLQVGEYFLSKRNAFMSIGDERDKAQCFALASLLHDGIVVVLTQQLQSFMLEELERLSIAAALWTRDLSIDQRQKLCQELEQGNYRILLVEPGGEQALKSLIKDLPVSLIAIDDVHLSDPWSSEFSYHYFSLARSILELAQVPKLLLTPMAREQDKQWLCKRLGIESAEWISTRMLPESLKLRLIRSATAEEQKTVVLNALLNMSGPGVVYAATRRQVIELVEIFRAAGLEGIEAYHGGKSKQQLERICKGFEQGDINCVVATYPFAQHMKPIALRYVFHANMPSSIDAYVRAAVQAGKDKQPAYSYLFYGPRDFFVQRFLIENSLPEESELQKVHLKLNACYLQQSAVTKEQLELAFDGLEDKPSREELNLSLDFLLRAGVLTRNMQEPFVYKKHRHYSKQELKDTLRRAKASKISRLRAIHKLVKSQAEPSEYIEDYYL